MMKTVLILLLIFTITYIVAVVYANINVRNNDDSSSLGKYPVEYGIWVDYFAEKLESEPQKWNASEELGIILGERREAAEKETYDILIVDEGKALPWMKGIVPEPDAVKYNDEFYNIAGLWTEPAYSESVKSWQFPIGGILGTYWVFTGILFLKERKHK
ncbi:hypothetical protein HXY33_05360 [Candidatus Bathyarchaeota archaeon]|nr:hypothetical protein [Candidatus Bathyarchaeota archaeon]